MSDTVAVRPEFDYREVDVLISVLSETLDAERMWPPAHHEQWRALRNAYGGLVEAAKAAGFYDQTQREIWGRP